MFFLVLNLFQIRCIPFKNQKLISYFLSLDIDPEEFDVIEPRLLRPLGGVAVPVLQFADHLVNGAGFCVALGTRHANGTTTIGSLLSQLLRDQSQYPLVEFLRDDHERTCEQGCYRCLLRYRNQPYHGLLDWRLGLSFLNALDDSNYRCGLDGDFSGPALRTWPGLVEQDVWRLRRQFAKLQTKQFGPVLAVKFDGVATWCVVAHPLWDPAVPTGILSAAIERLDGEPYAVADSFNLARRPWTIRRALTDMG